MFVSSYNTYVQTNTSTNTSKQKIEDSSVSSKSFASKVSQTSTPSALKGISLPLDYISKSQVLNTKQELDYQKQQLDKPENNLQKNIKETINKFTATNSLANAKSAYESNSKMFSQFRVPHATISKIPSIENTLPSEPKEIKELNMRHKMVNTYISNDSYYQVTA